MSLFRLKREEIIETHPEIESWYVAGHSMGVMNKSLYDKRKEWNTKDFEEHIIAGANHAQFGDYGEQPRDNDAGISAEEQQRKTSEIILDWLSRRNAPKAQSNT